MTLLEQYMAQIKTYNEMLKTIESEEYKRQIYKDIKKCLEKIGFLKQKGC